MVADMVTTNTRILTDGTVLKRALHCKFMRDADGRTRIEQDGQVFINDPVRMRFFVLNPAERTAYNVVHDTSLRKPVAMPQGGAPLQASLRAELGQKVIEGIVVTGKEWVNTIPAKSSLGNDRAIEQTPTVWYSEMPGLPIRTTVNSSLSGTSETSFQNIQTGVELNFSLFDVPADYKMVAR
jgi:outer membrane lipoprotein-sorting protein